MKMNRAKAVVFALLASCTVSISDAGAAGLAVKRGQESVAPSKLPVVCLTFGTRKTGMPVHAVTVVGLGDSKRRKFVVSKTLGGSRPDYLTALSGETMLCLVTLSLPAGDYLLDSIQYTGGRGDEFDYSFYFSEYMKLKFTVVPDAVNFVGSVEFSAPWMLMRMARATSRNFGAPSLEEKVDARIYLKDSAARDLEWVHDQIPGLRPFKSHLSRLEEIDPAASQAK